MEESAKLDDKHYDESCLAFLEELCAGMDPSETRTYARLDKLPEFERPLQEQKLKRLEELGVVKLSDYIRPLDGYVNPLTRQVDILPAGMQHLQTRTIEQTTTTHTKVTETIPVEEEPVWKLNKERKQRFGTERGYAINNSQVDDFLDDVKSNIMKIRRGDLPRKDHKVLQIWLKYALLDRGYVIPSELKAEARECRDLPWVPRRRRPC